MELDKCSVSLAVGSSIGVSFGLERKKSFVRDKKMKHT
jgi:hypothetical protein